MATLIGSTLEPALVERLSGRESLPDRQLVLPLCTVDPDGWPHVALLSQGEIAVRDPATLRAALYADSRTAAHLRETGRATLLVFDEGLARYIKVRASEVPGQIAAAPWNAVFELHVEQVLGDAADPGREGTSVLTGGITVRPDPRAERTRAAVRAALQAG